MNRPRWQLAHSVYCAIFLILVARPASSAPPQPIDERRAESVGIRKLTSKHLVLFTDTPSSPEIDRLPTEFDKAVPQWAAYFGIDPAKVANWRPRAFLIADERRFAALGLLPPGSEGFENGISIGPQMWLRDQPTDYYRRHLLLHEGTHAFMNEFLGGCGPGWYMEGMAELLGTHHLDPKTGDLALNFMPKSRDEVPMLGRIKLIHDALAEHRPLSFTAVMQLDGSKQLGSEAYAWCWVATKFLDSHPRYSDRFRELHAHVRDPNFNELVRKKFADDWADLNAEWPAYIAALDYGYDYDRMAIDFKSHALINAGRDYMVAVAADRGWQSSGVKLEARKSYKITATGRYQIAADQSGGKEEPWPCEPGGITIEYHDGKPLGVLLGAIDSRDKPVARANPTFENPVVIGLHTTLKPSVSGTLYLRVNDSAGKLGDNRGMLNVRIQALR